MILLEDAMNIKQIDMQYVFTPMLRHIDSQLFIFIEKEGARLVVTTWSYLVRSVRSRYNTNHSNLIRHTHGKDIHWSWEWLGGHVLWP